MPNLIRCKACGFVIQEERLGDVCPRAVCRDRRLKPYKEKVSENRQKILDMHLHPVLVHFPKRLEFYFGLVCVRIHSHGRFLKQQYCVLFL